MKAHFNRLKGAKSPYLLQHAENPVDWYPWGREAFEAAKREDKPIFLSIGYSACHWCHVMEKESFEDTEIADILNRYFISVKVDREEHPHVDELYMKACIVMNGNGGWPLTIIMTPEGKPFFAGTYFPKESRFGRAGLKEILLRVAELWKERRSEVYSAAEKVWEVMEHSWNERPARPPASGLMEKTFEAIGSEYDSINGGFGNAPKFPMASHLFFLSFYFAVTGDPRALKMLNTTLIHMRAGGIFDQVGGGFHRYSVTPDWSVPHFEKMLYDQAFLSQTYVEGYAISRNEIFKDTFYRILEYVTENLTSPEGLFYSSQDAESGGEEGLFYTWTHDEIESMLSSEEKELMSFSMRLNPFSENGRGTLSLIPEKLEVIFSDPDKRRRFDQLTAKLKEGRMSREKPGVDDKVIVGWNAYYISALFQGSFYFQDEALKKLAEKSLNSLINLGVSKGMVFHALKDGEAYLNGYLEDYSAVIRALLDGYLYTGESHYLELAVDLTDSVFRLFSDKKGILYTAPLEKSLVNKPADLPDLSMPSAVSVLFEDLIKLGILTGKTYYLDRAEALAEFYTGLIDQVPSSAPYFLRWLLTARGHYLVAVVGEKQGSEFKKLLAYFQNTFLPNVFWTAMWGKDPVLEKVSEQFTGRKMLNGRTTFYVCKGDKCYAPVTHADAAVKFIK